MKLIEEKKYLEEFFEYVDKEVELSPGTKDRVDFVFSVRSILSKHLKDLPKKELEFKPVKNTRYDTEVVRNLNERSKGYNQCLEDCEKS